MYTLIFLENLKWSHGDLTAAETYGREALTTARRAVGDVHLLVAAQINNLAGLRDARGDLRGAEGLLRESIQIYRRLPSRMVDEATAEMNLGAILTLETEYAEAERPLIEGGIDTDLRDDPEVRATLHRTIGTTYRDFAMYDAGERHLRASLDLDRKTLGDHHPEVARSASALGRLYSAKGDYERAEPLLVEARCGARQRSARHGNANGRCSHPDKSRGCRHASLARQDCHNRPRFRMSGVCGADTALTWAAAARDTSGPLHCPPDRSP